MKSVFVKWTFNEDGNQETLRKLPRKLSLGYDSKQIKNVRAVSENRTIPQKLLHARINSEIDIDPNFKSCFAHRLPNMCLRV